jgi:ATP-dependent Lon protease
MRSWSCYLGQYHHQDAGAAALQISQIEEKDQIGLVTGLAWTQVGGELLFVETLTMPGQGQAQCHRQTGRRDERIGPGGGELRPFPGRLSGHRQGFSQKLDLHIHIPEGAIPKDGPSAGIAMCTSLVSALTRRPARRDVAMTGEITLRGRVLPIGGLKEKMLAAHRGGIRQGDYHPKENEKDLRDIPTHRRH